MLSVLRRAIPVAVCAAGLEPPFVKAVAYGSYDGGLRELIHLLKYEQVRPAAAVLGRMLAEAVSGLESGWTQDRVMVVPVPLHARKLRQRGFNQSELIARAAIERMPQARSGKRPAGPAPRSSGAAARNPIPDRTHRPSAPRKHSGFVCCGPAGGNRRPRNPAGGRCVHHRHHGVGMRSRFAPGGCI